MIIAGEPDQELWGCDHDRCSKGASSSFVPIVWCCFLFVVTLLAGLSWATIAQAEDIGLSFDLASSQASPGQTSPGQASPQQAVEPVARPKPTPAQPVSANPAPIAFNLPSASDRSTEVAAAPPVESAPAGNADIFAGGSDSLVARAVGSAEGTRTPTGDRTSAYYGHVDPGNGAWNLGSFSYQHEASSPEDADERQLKRLQAQAATLQAKAAAQSLNLTLAEKLNGIDLANQSPRAALEREGYIDRLAQAREMGLQGSEAVLWARTRSFLDPDSQQWNAPGLGNNVYSISHDQERRQQAIEQAIAAQQFVRLPEAQLPEAQLPEAQLPEAQLPEAQLPEAQSPETASDPTEKRPPDTVASSPSPTPSAPSGMGNAQSETIDRLLQMDLSSFANP